ncbi:MAG: hypothetical protein OSB34_14855 [Planktomarina sp.]|nr:hypothetical protein [Planktomarina sp.]|tara:strand:- start:830 stop:1492 length:663 start_codon:yes stop_codon:yes gene_type:complete
MIGEMSESFKLKTSALALTFCLVGGLASSAYADCNQFEAESEAVSGAVPRFNEDGSVRAIVVYGEGTFLVPKRSLIKKARQVAELSAKRAFASWMKESVSGGTAVSEMMEQVEQTNQDGETLGLVTELTTIVDNMSSNTEATIRGLVKLDECVDKQEKYVLVEMGWKPSLAQAAGDAGAQINQSGQSSQSEENSPSEVLKKSKITESQGYRKKSSLKDDF